MGFDVVVVVEARYFNFLTIVLGFESELKPSQLNESVPSQPTNLVNPESANESPRSS